MKRKSQIQVCALLLGSSIVIQPNVINATPLQTDKISGPVVSETIRPLSSGELLSLPPATDRSVTKTTRPRQNPLRTMPDQGRRGTWKRSERTVDPLLMSMPTEDVFPSLNAAAPALLLSFGGTNGAVGCGGCSPPDTVGDVSPNHYVQMVNATKIAVYSKSGILLAGPYNLSNLWPESRTSTCDDPDWGDPVVLYDQQAKRWLLSQFAASDHLCIAVSKTADPRGAYSLYEFSVGAFPDYFKFGVWPDAYYMSANESTYTAYAFDRAKMLAGLPATFQKFTGGTNLYLPADLDGDRAPPTGTPGYFYTFKDNVFHGGNDRIEVYAFHVDWIMPANSTFTLQNSINIAPFTYTVCGFFNFNCIKQLGTTQRFDAVSEWPMFRFPYRNFGSYQALAGTFTVGGGLGETGAAPRWFELRKTSGAWSLFQEGTFDPGDGIDRVMPSIAMDKFGNIALGYSASRSTMYPAIRYTVHRIGDTKGTMQTEASLIEGSGSQTGSNRWGDYSAMSVDPADGVSFWYTNEYYPVSSSSNWSTRIGKFRVIETISLPSVAANDGWVLESAETSGIGGTLNNTATSFNLGDAAAKQQYRAILHFNTSVVPDTAVLTGATLKIKQAGLVGKNPFTQLGGLKVDIHRGYFGAAASLAVNDFQAAAEQTGIAAFNTAPMGLWYHAALNATARAYINRTGTTQYRLRFAQDDNNDAIADYMKFFSGDYATVTDRPTLVIQYYMP